MKPRLLFIHAFSPLHAGTGQSVGAIDLAIARERATGIPYLPGSSIKGVLRDRFSQEAGDNNDKVFRLFGPDTANAAEHAGSVHFGDGRLVFLPVRSLAGTFAYVTSPYLLDRLSTDVREAGLGFEVPVPTLKDVQRCILTGESMLLLGAKGVVLEDLDFQLQAVDTELKEFCRALGPLVADEAWGESLVGRICVVHDDVMSFLMEQATEVSARIRLDQEKKTVAQGALWYEENLPAESVLASLVMAQPPKRTKLTAEQALDQLGEGLDGMTQLGGKATVGRGLCRLRLAGGSQ